jgi:hypothetical protein
MNTKSIPDSSGFTKTPEMSASFAAPPAFFELAGPGTLVRLVQSKKTTYDGLRLGNSRRDGLFWFEEALLVRVRNQARLELTRQQAEAKRPFSAPLGSLATLYMRHYLRGDLAICKDWTNDFDGYVSMRLLAGDRLVALVGPVAKQPAYSPQHPQHQVVVAKSVWLGGAARRRST